MQSIAKMVHKILCFVLGPSGSGERNNGAIALQNSAPEQIDNEPITWNWNPQSTSKQNNEPKTTSDNHGEYMAHALQHNCYGQKRKRNNVRGGNDDPANGKNLSIWSDDVEGTDMKNSNFWTKVLFNNTSNNNNGSSNNTTRRTNNLFPSSSSTAVIFNSIISNLKDHHPKSNGLNDVDGIDRNFNMSDGIATNNGDGTNAGTSTAASLPSTTTSCTDTSFNLTTSKSKNVLLKQKCAKNRSEHSNEMNQQEKSNEGDRMTLNNDLNAANSTFLRALNDLHLDYNELTTTHSIINRQEQNDGAAQSTSKERYLHKMDVI